MPDEVIQQTPSKKVRKHFSKKKKLIIFLIIFVVLILASLLIFGYFQIQTNSRNEEAAKFVSEASSYSNLGENDKAIASYDKAINKTDDLARKSALLINKASVYLVRGNNSEALKIAKEAESVDENVNVMQFIAQIYSLNGDKENTIKYLQKAISFIDTTAPMGKSKVIDYQARIKALQSE